MWKGLKDNLRGRGSARIIPAILDIRKSLLCREEVYTHARTHTHTHTRVRAHTHTVNWWKDIWTTGQADSPKLLFPPPPPPLQGAAGWDNEDIGYWVLIISVNPKIENLLYWWTCWESDLEAGN